MKVSIPARQIALKSLDLLQYLMDKKECPDEEIHLVLSFALISACEGTGITEEEALTHLANDWQTTRDIIKRLGTNENT